MIHFYLIDAFDPTGLADVRAGIERETTRRWSKTAREVKRAIVMDDALGIGPKAPRMAQPAADKASMFKRWLDERLLLGIVGHDAGWIKPHVDAASERAYRRVLHDAGPDDEPRDDQGRWTAQTDTPSFRTFDPKSPPKITDQANLGFLLPGAAPSAGVCHAASVSALASICDDVSRRAHASVAASLLSQAKPAHIARLLDQAFGGGLQRSRMLAEHAVTQAYSQASLDALEARGVTHVGTISESAMGRADRASAIWGRDGIQTAAGVMFVDPDGNALFLHRTDGEGWAWPGGGVEEPESLENGAAREAQEECGGAPIGPVTKIWRSNGHGVDFTTFRQDVGAQFTPTLNHEHDDHVWAPLDEPPSPLHPGVAEMLRGLALTDEMRFTPQPRHPRTGRYAPEHVVARETRRHPKTGRLRAQGISLAERHAEERAEARFAKVKGKLDVVTAGDDRVCDVCDAISENGPYTIGKARSLIPAHPRCRCLFVAADSITLDAHLSALDFDPDEPRDDKGKWSSGSGGLVSGADRAAWPSHIQALKLPPAWTDVRINPDPEADLLAIGKDKKGRSQYVYSAKFQGDQAAQKFNRIAALESAAPGIAAKNAENRASSDSVVAEHADALHLVMQTGVRPGSEDDTGADKKAYGATTLEGRHVTGSGASTTLQFVGKKGVSLNVPIADPGVASMLATRAAAAGSGGQLFPNVSDSSLRDYVHGVAGNGVKVKDFRTLVGTSTARAEVAKMAAPKNAADYKKAIMSVAKVVSSKLGNTPTIALQSYIHPNVFAGWANG